jgi:hypothetical protein
MRLLALVRLLPLRRLRTNERLLPLRRLRANDYFIYIGSALRSYACIDCVRLHRLRSLTMSDIGKSGDVVTQPSTGYFLKPMFIFISCIIMNIAMFNCCLNIHTCTWIISLTVILKCIFNYGIKIYQNVAYHLTQSISALCVCCCSSVKTLSRLYNQTSSFLIKLGTCPCVAPGITKLILQNIKHSTT